MSEKTKVDIPAATIIKVALTLIGLYIVFLLRDVFVLTFVALILVAAFRPVINKWSRKIGRPLAIISLLLIMIAVVAGFVYLIIPPFVSQAKALYDNIPDLITRFPAIKGYWPVIRDNWSSLSQTAGSVTGSFIEITAGFFGGIVTFLTVIILTVYLLIDEKVFVSMSYTLIPQGHREEIVGVIRKVATKIGEWFRGQLLLGLIMGVLSYIAYLIMGLPYALALGVIAGVLEILPIIGPLIAGVLAALIALTVSPLIFFISIALTLILHQLENAVMVPKVMQKATGLPPAVVIIVILIGGKLLGVIGALLALPVAVVIKVLIEERATIRNISGK